MPRVDSQKASQVHWSLHGQRRLSGWRWSEPQSLHVWRRLWLEKWVSLLKQVSLPVPVKSGTSWWVKRLQWWPCPLNASQQWHIASRVAQASSTNSLSCGSPHSHPFRLSLQLSFRTPTALLSLGLLFKSHFPAPKLPPYQETHGSGWGMPGCGMNHKHTSYTVQPPSDWLISVFPSSLPEVSFLPQFISPLWIGFSECGNLSSLSASHKVWWIRLVSSFIYFFFPWYGDFSYSFRCTKSSASVKQVLCENCSVFRYILDVLVKRGEFHVLLFCHLDSSPWTNF